MKKLLISLLIVLLPFSLAFGANVLTCDPTSDDVEWYEIVLDGAAVQFIAAVDKDGHKVLEWPLPTLASGSHTVKVLAANKWGKSDWAVLEFNTQIPGACTGIKIERR